MVKESSYKKNTFSFIHFIADTLKLLSVCVYTPKTYIPTGAVQNTLIADNSTDGKRNNVNFNTNYIMFFSYNI